MKPLIIAMIHVVMCLQLPAQTATVYPTNWWAGMVHNKLQLLVSANGTNTFGSKLTVTNNSKDITITKVANCTNKKYVLVDVTIAPKAKPSNTTFTIRGASAAEKYTVPFALKPKRKGNGTLYAQGATTADVMYLLMPDRFSNGDVTNDRVPGMLDQSLNRDTVYNRHGGDLKGVQNHLDYFTELGITTLWLNPVIENDMPDRTEHGYAFTNHYVIDRRLGGEQAYSNLVDACHAKGLKIFQDAVYNHVGSEHILYKQMPDSSWFHWWPKYTNTTYKDQTLLDPHAAKADVKRMTDGWFVPTMPDWNHHNKAVENYLIQHALWTVEEFGIDGWRIDTYAYNDLEFMNRCNKALMTEYPKIFLFGETWVQGVPNQSYFTQNIYEQTYKSNLQGVTDFQALWAIKDALTKDFGWTDGVNKLYTTMSYDFVYKQPNNNVVFLDNHDINRFYSDVNQDMGKYKIAIGWLCTTRGIPQLYYGNELAVAGVTSPNDGYVRLDFMGGWADDKQNKFTKAGRSVLENDIFDYTKLLLNYRKQSNVLKYGTYTQYVPEDAVYVYARMYKGKTVLVIMNTAKEKRTFASNRFEEVIGKASNMRNIVTNKTHAIPEKLEMDPMSILIAELN